MHYFTILEKYWNKQLPVKISNLNITFNNKPIFFSITPLNFIFSIKEFEDTIIVNVNSDIEANEINFVFAFSLYYILNNKYFNGYIQNTIDKNNKIDMEALNFALNIVLPTHHFKEISKKYISINKICESFGVSQRIIKQKERQLKNSSL